jgi:hypothetical protein
VTTAQAWSCAQARRSLGVYVLGALDIAERDLTAEHLLTCEECQGQVADLAGLPEFLSRLDAAEAGRACAGDSADMADAGAASGHLPGAVLELVRARRRRNWWRGLAAAAVIAAIAAALFGSSLGSAGPARVTIVPLPAGGGGWHTVQAASRITGVSATIIYAQQLWGTSVEVLTDRIPPGATCQLWAVHPGGTRTLAAAWTNARDEGHVWYAGSVPSSAGAVAKFEITADGKIILTVLPA